MRVLFWAPRTIKMQLSAWTRSGTSELLTLLINFTLITAQKHYAPLSFSLSLKAISWYSRIKTNTKAPSLVWNLYSCKLSAHSHSELADRQACCRMSIKTKIYLFYGQLRAKISYNKDVSLIIIILFSNTPIHTHCLLHIMHFIIYWYLEICVRMFVSWWMRGMNTITWVTLAQYCALLGKQWHHFYRLMSFFITPLNHKKKHRALSL